MLRVIQELRPTWVLGENVPGIVNLALDTVLSDLENLGYSTQAFVVPACGVDAPHKRERCAILAYSINGRGALRRDGKLQDLAEDGRARSDNRRRTAAAITGEWWKDEPRPVGMVDGLRAEVYGADTDSNGYRLQGRNIDEVLASAFTGCSSRERERESKGRGYDGLLRSFLELTPRGIIGRMNPNWIEWLLGYPIGWTELNASETP